MSTDTPDPGRPLSGVGVLITRPAHQAGRLARLIESAGGNAVRFPAIEIAPPADPAALAAVLDRLAEFDLAVFVSANAVEQAFARLRARGQHWPSSLPAACIGRATAGALGRAGVDPLTPPARFDSEALLALPALSRVRGRQVVIFRGEGGRELLAETLAERGAKVVYAECYRRVRPRADPTPLIERFRRNEIHAVCITSTDGLRNLHDVLGEAGREHLAHTPVVVLSAAQAAACRRLGVAAEPLIATEASDEAILEALKAWRLRRFSL